jgi:hypothetical protein
VVLISVTLTCIIFLYNVNGKSGFWQERFYRYENLRENGFRGDFFDGYIGAESTRYPKLGLDTFWGTGMMSGKSGRGDVVNVDGGPLRVYSAIGLLMTIVVYLMLIRILFLISKGLYKRNGQYLLYTFAVLILIGDFKEPTLLSIWPMTLFFTVAYLSGNELMSLNQGFVGRLIKR